jgi:hypothetical protein
MLKCLCCFAVGSVQQQVVEEVIPSECPTRGSADSHQVISQGVVTVLPLINATFSHGHVTSHPRAGPTLYPPLSRLSLVLAAGHVSVRPSAHA